MKNKIKKIFSKITILVLLVAMLIPYTSIPKAEAATEECPENTTPEYHTNYYFFLIANAPHTWVNWLGKDFAPTNPEGKGDGKVVTTNYTSFPYNFPTDGSKIIFEDDGFVNLTDSTDYNENYNAGTKAHREEWPAGQFYYEWNSVEKEKGSGLSDYMYLSGEGKSDDNRIVTYLFHGDWGTIEIDSEDDSPNWNPKNEIQLHSANKISNDIEKQVAASIFIDDELLSAGNFNLEFDIEDIKDAIKNYNEHGSTESIVKLGKNIDKPVINMIIQRTYEKKDIFTKSDKVPDYLVGTKAYYGENSYDIDYDLKEGETLSYPIKDENGNETDRVKVSDIQAIKSANDTATGFLGPNLYQISYTVCKAKEIKEDKVLLTYHANEPEKTSEKANDIPGSVEKTKGSEFTIAEKEPSLKGYKFQSWSKNSDCSGDKYEAGYELGKLEKNTDLYACWGSTDGDKGSQTGVLTYTGLFGGVIALAAGSYYIMKKKNLFKQI